MFPICLSYIYFDWNINVNKVTKVGFIQRKSDNHSLISIYVSYELRGTQIVSLHKIKFWVDENLELQNLDVSLKLCY